VADGLRTIIGTGPFPQGSEVEDVTAEDPEGGFRSSQNRWNRSTVGSWASSPWRSEANTHSFHWPVIENAMLSDPILNHRQFASLSALVDALGEGVGGPLLPGLPHHDGS
jgi:hypothetical protein